MDGRLPAPPREWFDDWIGHLDCCGPTKIGDFGQMEWDAKSANARRGFGRQASTQRAASSRSTIGSMGAFNSWEFDDAHPDTWPEDVGSISYAHLASHRPSAGAGNMLRESHLSPEQNGSVECVEEFIRTKLKLGRGVCSVIRDEKIDALVILACSKMEIAGLGIEKLGDQKKLLLFAQAAVAKDAATQEWRADVLEEGGHIHHSFPGNEALQNSFIFCVSSCVYSPPRPT